MKATFEHQTWAPTELINDNTITLIGVALALVRVVDTNHRYYRLRNRDMKRPFPAY